MDVPPELAPILAWTQANIHPALNGILLNWYDAAHKHYIGKHRDSDIDRVPGSDIVTISLGEERVFRMRRHRGDARVDIHIPHGSVVVIPWSTNRAWTHEVPRFARHVGRRVAITVRAFFDADVLVLTDIYGAREVAEDAVSGATLAHLAESYGHRVVHYVPDNNND